MTVTSRVIWGHPVVCVHGMYRGYDLEVFQNVNSDLFDGCRWAARATKTKEIGITFGAYTMDEAKAQLIKAIDKRLD